jgi:hypothetical protein
VAAAEHYRAPEIHKDGGVGGRADETCRSAVSRIPVSSNAFLPVRQMSSVNGISRSGSFSDTHPLSSVSRSVMGLSV